MFKSKSSVIGLVCDDVLASPLAEGCGCNDEVEHSLVEGFGYPFNNRSKDSFPSSLGRLSFCSLSSSLDCCSLLSTLSFLSLDESAI